nr:small, acid-soluble spore protein, alpha/beta type [uncultured Faecalimonas sp.]
MAKKKKIILSELEPEEKLKYEIAEELGLLDQVMQKGWESLSSRETGRIGGIVKNRRKMFRNCEQSGAGVEK